jgi:hypothetical protein
MAKTPNVVSILRTQQDFLEKEKERIDKELKKINDALVILDTGEEVPRKRGRRKKTETAAEES